MNRRELLSTCIKAAGATVAGIVALPLAIHSLSPALRSGRKENWRPLGPIAKFPMSKIVAANVQIALEEGSLNQKGVFVWRQQEEEFVVYSKSCTDLGCPLTYDPGSEWFYCPCHGGIFDKEGQRRAGPPKVPMWRYQNRVRKGVLEIDLHSVPPMV